jgi:hypothetical protein
MTMMQTMEEEEVNSVMAGMQKQYQFQWWIDGGEVATAPMTRIKMMLNTS